MPTLNELQDALKNAHAAGDVAAAQKLADAIVAASPSSYQEGKNAPGALQGLVSALQGPTFGFADELGGGVAALGQFLGNKILPKPMASAVPQKSPSASYFETRDFLRGASDKRKEENPLFTAVTQGMTAAPTIALQSGGAVPMGVVSQTMNAGKFGAGFGGLSALGESTAEDLKGMALDTAKGAAIGGAVSGVFAPTARAAGAAGNVVLGKFNESSASRFAKQKIAEAFARDSVGSMEGNAIGQALARYMKLGPEARVADSGGQSTKALLDLMATLPGKTKQAADTMIHDRQAGRAGRMTAAAEQALNPSGVRLIPTLDELVASRKEAAAPLYENLYKTGVFVNEELKGIIEAANKLGAGSAAKTIATAKKLPYTITDNTKWAGMRELDYLKQGLDDIIQANTDIAGHTNKVGAAVLGLKHDLVSLLDSETKGLYKQARDAFAGPSALISAAKEGRKFLTLDDQTIAKAQAAMSESEREAFKMGAFEALRTKLGRESGQTEIMKMWKEPATSERLKELFGNEREFRVFAAKVAAEARLKGLETVGRGSQTAARQYAAGDFDAGAIGDTASALTNAKVGNVPGMLGSAAGLWNRVKTPEPVRNAIGATLLSKGTEGERNLAAMQQIMREVSDARMRQTLGLGLLGGQSNNVLTGLLSQ